MIHPIPYIAFLGSLTLAFLLIDKSIRKKFPTLHFLPQLFFSVYFVFFLSLVTFSGFFVEDRNFLFEVAYAFFMASIVTLVSCNKD